MARVAGWLVLLVGLSFALGLGLLVYALATVAAALAFALPLALVVLIAGVVLLQSGRLLSRSGATVARTIHDHALLELASHRGPVTAPEAARALGLSASDADAILTDLAKREPDRVVLDIDDNGVIRYRAVNAPDVAADVHVRVGPEVRVGEHQPVAVTSETETDRDRATLQDEADAGEGRAVLRR